MSARKHLYSRWPFELPTLLLVSLWVGVWFAWPRLDSAPHRARPPTDTRIRYVTITGDTAPRREDLLGFLFQPRERELITDTPAPLLVAPSLVAQPHVRLDRQADPALALFGAETPALVRDAAAGLRGYRPAWPLLNPFGNGPAYGLRVELQPGRALSDRGYTVPVEALATLNDGDKAWEFTYYVVCDNEGRTRDVFAMAAPVTSGLMSNMISVLSQGRVRPGQVCEGRVTVRRVYTPVAMATAPPVRKE